MRVWKAGSVLFLLSVPAFAGITFFDNFENGALISSDTNWVANTFGLVAPDPLNPANHVLEFTNLHGGGDLFSAAIAGSAQKFLSFDYLYLNGPYGGGFLGVNDPGETWLLGDCNGCFSTFSDALDTTLHGLAAGQWHHIQVQFPSFSGGAPYQLKLEQFQTAAPNAYFDNIVIADDAFASVVPEPGSATLLLAGLIGAAWARRRSSSRA